MPFAKKVISGGSGISKDDIDKINKDIETRFNALTSSQQQDAEVIDARDGETSLKARLDRDIEKAKQVYINVEGSNISTDSSSGYLKDIEILGNTVQDASNLADIRSVGDKVEGQELYEIPVVSCGKNIWNPSDYNDLSTWIDGTYMCKWIKLKPNTTYMVTSICKKIPQKQCVLNVATGTWNGAGVQILHTVFNYTNANAALGLVRTGKFTTPSDGVVCLQYYENNHRLATADLTEWINEISDIQLEEGTVATPYEPYQEGKLTILSPVQIEKVGNVRDRIICKDGVWGVEKNVETVVLNGSENWSASTILVHEITRRFSFVIEGSKNGQGISNLFIYKNNDDDDEHLKIGNDASKLFVYINKSRLAEDNVFGFKTWLNSNNLTLKYVLNTSRFIPLPHDQQVKLRTFANKTNISFLTEIEGTIKAQVPKLIGATVNTHTEQINNLNKELDRVKKLEESTVSTVETESDFTTVEATSNGYFEDVKLEGNTLVNLVQNAGEYTLTRQSVESSTSQVKCDTFTLDKNKDYTVIYIQISREGNTPKFNIVNSETGNPAYYNTALFDTSTTGYEVVIKKINQSFNWRFMRFYYDGDRIGTTKFKLLLLEGDHTQNPPSYFEGLKSVGQSATTSEDGTDEIVVSSVKGDGNLFDGNWILGKTLDGSTGLEANQSGRSCTDFIRAKENTKYVLEGFVRKMFNCYDSNKNFLGNSNNTYITLPNTSYIRVSIDATEDFAKALIIEANNYNGYVSYQSDKKRLLYYNEETQAWEKPILRQWDSIEKHADGKYYYHQRSGEVVLNGSENWVFESNQSSSDTLLFYTSINDALGNQLSTLICDKFKSASSSIWGIDNNSELCMISPSKNFMVRVSKSKLSTQDVQGFKQWLQANNVTVVYQLAQEKVYECTNIDLITYANETNYIVDCGAIVPRTTLKVHNNISNVVSLLQKKVSILENDCLQMFKYILAGDIQSLAYSLYPEDFSNISTENIENTSIVTAESTSTVNTSIKSIEDTEELPENDGIIEEGTIDNPIKFSKEINLEVGKYYTDYNVLYICIKSTTEPPTVRLNKLVDEYVQKV